MVDQDEKIDRELLSCFRELSDPRWERLADSYDAETVASLRRDAEFEAFRLLYSLLDATKEECIAGAPFDETVTENIRRGGSPEFKGDRNEVRRVLQEVAVVKEAVFDRLFPE